MKKIYLLGMLMVTSQVCATEIFDSLPTGFKSGTSLTTRDTQKVRKAERYEERCARYFDKFSEESDDQPSPELPDDIKEVRREALEKFKQFVAERAVIQETRYGVAIAFFEKDYRQARLLFEDNGDFIRAAYREVQKWKKRTVEKTSSCHAESSPA